MTRHPIAFYGERTTTLVLILFLIVRHLQSIQLRNQIIHRRRMLFEFLGHNRRRRQWMFLAMQQNINNGTEGERKAIRP